MGKVVYSMSVSLDGFAAAPDGSLDWVMMDDELHAYFNDQARAHGAFLYGRRLYELMTAYWPTANTRTSRPSRRTSRASGGRSRRSSSRPRSSVWSGTAASPGMGLPRKSQD